MGITWCIPTYTEWYNVDLAGNWGNWNGQWNSGLKMHAAGLVNYSDGRVYYRGSEGHYWSSTQADSNSGYHLDIRVATSVASNAIKAFGCSIRCIRDN